MAEGGGKGASYYLDVCAGAHEEQAAHKQAAEVEERAHGARGGRRGEAETRSAGGAREPRTTRREPAASTLYAGRSPLLLLSSLHSCGARSGAGGQSLPGFRPLHQQLRRGAMRGRVGVRLIMGVHCTCCAASSYIPTTRAQLREPGIQQKSLHARTPPRRRYRCGPSSLSPQQCAHLPRGTLHPVTCRRHDRCERRGRTHPGAQHVPPTPVAVAPSPPLAAHATLIGQDVCLVVAP